LPILRATFHTSFVDCSNENGRLVFDLHELDDTDDEWKYRQEFVFSIDYRSSDRDRPFTADPPAFWTYDAQTIGAKLIVADRQERGKCVVSYTLR
jgi:hypothetical protein